VELKWNGLGQDGGLLVVLILVVIIISESQLDG
jgi:hypothetical protein